MADNIVPSELNKRNKVSSESEKYVLKILEGKSKLIDMINSNKNSIKQEIIRNLDEELASGMILERMNIKKLKRNDTEISKFSINLLNDQSKSIQNTLRQKIFQFNEETQRVLKELDSELSKKLNVKNDDVVTMWFASSLLEIECYGALEPKDIDMTKESTLNKFYSYLFVSYKKVLVNPTGGILYLIVHILTVLSSLPSRLRWKENTAEKIRETVLNRAQKLDDFNIELWKETNHVINNGFERIIRETKSEFF